MPKRLLLWPCGPPSPRQHGRSPSLDPGHRPGRAPRSCPDAAWDLRPHHIDEQRALSPRPEWKWHIKTCHGFSLGLETSFLHLRVEPRASPPHALPPRGPRRTPEPSERPHWALDTVYCSLCSCFPPSDSAFMFYRSSFFMSKGFGLVSGLVTLGQAQPWAPLWPCLLPAVTGTEGLAWRAPPEDHGTREGP